MKWIYGKRDYDTLQRGQENCWLMTNGLGGFSSMTMLGSVTRSDHAVLMACTQAPNYRYNVVHRLEETITTGERSIGFPVRNLQMGTVKMDIDIFRNFLMRIRRSGDFR